MKTTKISILDKLQTSEQKYNKTEEQAVCLFFIFFNV